MALPTPANVKALPLSVTWLTTFAAIPDDKIQGFIDCAAALLGSAEVKRHTQRDDAVLLLSAHLLAIQLASEGVDPGGGGGGGGGGPVSSRKLDGVGTINFGVQAFAAEQLADWYYAQSPWSTKLRAIIDTFPPGIATTGASNNDGGDLAALQAIWCG